MSKRADPCEDHCHTSRTFRRDGAPFIPLIRPVPAADGWYGYMPSQSCVVPRRRCEARARSHRRIPRPRRAAPGRPEPPAHRPPHSTIRATAEYGSKFRFFVSLLGKPCRYGEPVVGLKFVSNPATGTHQGHTRLTGVQP